MTECITPMLVPNDFLTYGGVTCRISRFFHTSHGCPQKRPKKRQRTWTNEQTIILPVLYPVLVPTVPGMYRYRTYIR